MKNRKNIEIKYDLSVGEVAERSGAAVSAIHFYERKGLISSRRNSGNQRIYSRSVLRRIAVVKFAQTLGIPLAEIKEALDNLPEKEIAGIKDWQKLSKKWKKDLDERIEKLVTLRDQLTNCIGCGCLSIKECALRNPSDELAGKGAGAVLLKQLYLKLKILANTFKTERTRAAYSPEHFLRLVALKNEYDPQNLFRFNHNIEPSTVDH